MAKHRKLIDRCVFSSIVILLGGLAIASSEPLAEGDASTTTSTLDEGACIVDHVVVDPDDRVGALEPGCTIELEGEAFGPGGTFDVQVSDNAGGGGGEYGFDTFSFAGSGRFSVAYTAGYSLPDLVDVTIDLAPHSPYFVCTGDTYGARGHKTIPKLSLAPDCVATFRVVDEVDLGELRFTVDYAASDAEVGGCGPGVLCESPMHQHAQGPFANTSAYDADDQRLLSLPVLSGQGFSTPVDVYRCMLRKHAGAADPTSDGFVVAVTSARSPPPLSKWLVDLPRVEVSVDCDVGPTTTTTLPYEPAICGQPCSVESTTPRARDALYVVNAAVGLTVCKTCICDVNRSGVIDATDALTVLSRAVGLDALVRCVECAAPVEPACAP